MEHLILATAVAGAAVFNYAALGYRLRHVKDFFKSLRFRNLVLPLLNEVGAQTTAADVADQTPELWGFELFHEALNQTFWHRFTGPPMSGAPISRRDDLEKQAGDTINIDLLMALRGAPQTGDTTSIEGNEEAMDYRQMSVTPEEYGHGVKWTKKARTFITHDMRNDAKAVLRKWLASFLDDLVWGELDGEQHGVAPAGSTTIPDQNHFTAGHGVKSGTTNDADDVANTAGSGQLSLTDISAARAYARADLKIEPLQIENGDEIYGLVVNPHALATLRNTTAWQQAAREAAARGAENPLFRGSLAMWDGVLIYESNRVYTEANVGAVSVARNILFGAEALSLAYASYPEWTEQYFDYRRKQGIAVDLIVGAKANVFDLREPGAGSADNQAIGHLVLLSAATAVAV